MAEPTLDDTEARAWRSHARRVHAYQRVALPLRWSGPTSEAATWFHRRSFGNGHCQVRRDPGTIRLSTRNHPGFVGAPGVRVAARTDTASSMRWRSADRALAVQRALSDDESPSPTVGNGEYDAGSWTRRLGRTFVPRQRRRPDPADRARSSYSRCTVVRLHQVPVDTSRASRVSLVTRHQNGATEMRSLLKLDAGLSGSPSAWL